MRDILQEIFSTLNQNKLRTTLTGLSVSWGIFILIILLGAGNGLKNGVMHNFQSRAVNSVSLWSGRTSIPHKGLKSGRNLQFDNKELDVVKNQVKDALVKALSPYLKDAKDKEEARLVLMEKMPLIKSIAKKTIEDKGYAYPVSVTLTSSYFPMKVYGDYVFPPGTYEALKVEIGQAMGENWWCLMFPPLCFVDETYTIVDENAEEKLEFLLTEEEFEVLQSKDTPIKVKFKLLMFIKKLFK